MTPYSPETEPETSPDYHARPNRVRSFDEIAGALAAEIEAIRAVSDLLSEAERACTDVIEMLDRAPKDPRCRGGPAAES